MEREGDDGRVSTDARKPMTRLLMEAGGGGTDGGRGTRGNNKIDKKKNNDEGRRNVSKATIKND